MFHYVEPDEELQQKKRIVKALLKANKVDRGLGLTKPESQKVDDLLRACEDIETQGAIVLKSLSQSLLRDRGIAQEPINRFYTIIRKGIFVLSRSTFRQTPRTDIQNLTDYRDNITKMSIALDETYVKLNEEAFGNEQLKGRTIEEYEAQTGRPYRPPVSAKALSEYINRTIAQEEKREGFSQGIQRLRALLQQKQEDLESLQDRIYDTQELRDAKVANRDRFRDQVNFVLRDYDALSPAEQMNRRARYEAIKVNFDREQRMIDDIDASLDELEQERRTLPSVIARITAQIERQRGIVEGLPQGNTQPLSPEEYANQYGYEQRAEVVNADFSLVMKELNKFLSSLTDGLIRYSSGVSSSLSKSQETNYRTPIQQAEERLGAGRSNLVFGRSKITDGIHKRFL